MGYTLGPVKPHVRQAANDIGKACNVRTIYGWGQRSGASDHPLGLALDFMVYSDSAKGDKVADMVIATAKEYGVTYLIWKQQINSLDGNGWEKMEDRGSVTQNHYDHVHVSYSANGQFTGSVTGAGVGSLPNPGGLFGGLEFGAGAAKNAEGIAAAILQLMYAASITSEKVERLSDPHFYARVGLVLGGGLLIIFALFSWDDVKGAVQTTATKMKGSGNG